MVGGCFALALSLYGVIKASYGISIGRQLLLAMIRSGTIVVSKEDAPDFSSPATGSSRAYAARLYLSKNQRVYDTYGIKVQVQRAGPRMLVLEMGSDASEKRPLRNTLHQTVWEIQNDVGDQNDERLSWQIERVPGSLW